MEHDNLCTQCILYSWRHNYCALDGKQHSGCYNNFRPDPKQESKRD